MWHYNETCFPALEWHWELLKIVFPSCQYLFWKIDSDQTNWNGITIARSYIPAGRSISGADTEQIIYDTFTATVYGRHTPHASELDLLPSLLDFKFFCPPGYSPPLTCSDHYLLCSCFCHLWLLPTIIFSFPGGYIENRAYLGRCSSEIVSLRIISIYSYFLWSTL